MDQKIDWIHNNKIIYQWFNTLSCFNLSGILCANLTRRRNFVKQTSLYHVILLIKIEGVLLLQMDLWRIEEASISHLLCILYIPEVFGRTFVKQISLFHVILLIKIQGVLLLKIDLWRIEDASISHLACILCIEVFGSTFVKETSLYHVILLVKVQGVLLLRMDQFRNPGASLVSDKV